MYLDESDLLDSETESAYLFKWTGAYAGFFSNNRLFDRSGRYLGWCDAEGSVWKYDGEWLGRVIEEHYLARDLRAFSQKRPPQVPPVPTRPPMPPAPRVARVPWPNCCDPLEALLRIPTSEELVGIWDSDDENLRFDEDGCFQWTAVESAMSMSATGHWELHGQELLLRWEGVAEPERVYWVIEFTGDSLLLRWMRKIGRSLPFWLRRQVAQSDLEVEETAGKPQAR